MTTALKVGLFGLVGYAAAIAIMVLVATSGTSKPASQVQTIYVRNASTFVTDAEVKNDMPAFQAATSKDFAPVWNVDAKLVFIGQDAAPKGSIVMTLLDVSDIPNALAYHELTDGVPDSKVFVGTSKYYGFNWTVGFTHELFEMLADPSINRAEQALDGKLWGAEVADPVESDADGYDRPGADGKPVRISDFITDKWFGALTAGPYDFVGHVQQPLVIDKGGYAQVWDGMGWIAITNFAKGGRGARVHY